MYPNTVMYYFALLRSVMDLKAPSDGKWQINLVFAFCFCLPDRSRPDLAEQEATSGVSKVTMSFLIWLQWRRASAMGSQWEPL